MKYYILRRTIFIIFSENNSLVSAFFRPQLRVFPLHNIHAIDPIMDPGSARTWIDLV